MEKYIIGKTKDGKDRALVTKVGVKVSGDLVKQNEIGKNWELLIDKKWIGKKKEDEVIESPVDDIVDEEPKKEPKKPKTKSKGKKQNKKMTLGIVKKKEEEIKPTDNESEADKASKKVYDLENKGK